MVLVWGRIIVSVQCHLGHHCYPFLFNGDAHLDRSNWWTIYGKIIFFIHLAPRSVQPSGSEVKAISLWLGFD